MKLEISKERTLDLKCDQTNYHHIVCDKNKR